MEGELVEGGMGGVDVRVLVRMELLAKLPVRLFELFFSCGFAYTEDLFSSLGSAWWTGCFWGGMQRVLTL